MTTVPCITETLQLSVQQLQRLFQTSKHFHDAKPWELLSNFNPVRIVVADGKDETRRELFAVVVGHHSWDGRGLYFYNSLQELKAAGSGTPDLGISQSVLRFCERIETPFGTLNQVKELGLDISTSDGADGEHSYPSWYSTTVAPSGGPPSEELLRTMRSTPPPQNDIPALTISTAAIAKLVTDRVIFSDVDEYGETRTKLPVGAVPVQVDLLNQELLVVTIEILQLNPNDFMPSEEVMLSSLSIGDRKVCNYCQKPRYLVEGKRLLACDRCQNADYCSKGAFVCWLMCD